MVVEHARAWSRLRGTDERPLGGPSDRLIWRAQRHHRHVGHYGHRRDRYNRRYRHDIEDENIYYWYNPGYWYNSGYWFEGFENEMAFNSSSLLVLTLILGICLHLKTR